MLKKFGLLGFTIVGLLIGCSEDSSSGTDAPVAETPSSAILSSAATVPDVPATSSDAQTTSVEGSSSSVTTPVDQSSSTPAEVGGFTSGAFTITATPDSNGFYEISEVYKAVPDDHKIVFVIRHAERQKSEGQESLLTEDGVAQAQALGQRIGPGEAFYYASTDFIRTRETCNNIAIGRGESAEVVTWNGINGDYFFRVTTDSLDAVIKSRGGSWKNISQWAYGLKISNAYVARLADGLFYDLFERGAQFVNEVVLANMGSWKRVSFLATHDVLIEPLVVYASNRQVDVNFSVSGRWVNYMTGIAVIVNPANEYILLPVRSYDVGWMVYVPMEE